MCYPTAYRQMNGFKGETACEHKLKNAIHPNSYSHNSEEISLLEVNGSTLWEEDVIGK